jgi:Sulfotransferase domain
MDITNGDGWDKLCPFLGLDIPDTPFPKSNVGAAPVPEAS